MTLPSPAPLPGDSPLPGESVPAGEPKIVSPTEGEDITPDNPEVIKHFPVDTTDKEAVDRANGQVPVDQHGQPLGTTRQGTTK